jgi:V8-like Glu-specific endopeptidase
MKRRLFGAPKPHHALSMLAFVLAAGCGPAGDETSETSEAALTGAPYPFVGALFQRGSSKHYCTASLITARDGLNLILTAAHCLGSSAVDFVPAYNGGRPHGTCKVAKTFFDARWTQHRDPRADFAFATLDCNGYDMKKYVGSNAIGVDATIPYSALVAGYPQSQNVQHTCTNHTKKFVTGGVTYPEFDCAGFSGGTSGSPWILNPTSSGHGYVVGVIGGYDEGGPTPAISYSSPFDHTVRELYLRAAQ